MVERVPAEAFPPGEYLRDELEARGWTQDEFAQIIGRPAPHVNLIIAGKRGITPATAKELGAALGTSPQFWLNLESAYRLWQADLEPARMAQIAREAKLRERFPVREIIKRGWIEASESPEVLETRVLQFFGVKTVDDPIQFAHAAKRSGKKAKLDDLTMMQYAWVLRVKQLAEATQAPRYSEQALRDALPPLRALMGDAEGVRHVPRILADCGVRLVIVEPLPGSKIDGVCFWLGERPVIGLSLRFDRVDNFWFVLLHEIEHVLRRHGRDRVIVDSELDTEKGSPDADLPDEERVANAAAGEFCVPAQALTDFIQRVHPMYSEVRVVGFARLLQVHPGLVVGQLQRRLERYELLRNYLVKIRHLIVPSAMTDGFGQTGPVTL
jgi:HTH-type transcriptional regulator/antitoxin HigA